MRMKLVNIYKALSIWHMLSASYGAFIFSPHLFIYYFMLVSGIRYNG